MPDLQLDTSQKSNVKSTKNNNICKSETSQILIAINSPNVNWDSLPVVLF